MATRILVVIPSRSLHSAVARSLEMHGHVVVVAATRSSALAVPGKFDCGVFALAGLEGDGVSLAGWLIAEDRVRAAVFFDDVVDPELVDRASNIGTLVHAGEGFEVLAGIVDELATPSPARARAVGAIDEHGRRRDLETGPRPKKHRSTDE